MDGLIDGWARARTMHELDNSYYYYYIQPKNQVNDEGLSRISMSIG